MLARHLWKMLTAAFILLCWIQRCGGYTLLSMTMRFDWQCKPLHNTSRVAYIQIRNFQQHPNNTQVLATARWNSSEVSSQFLSHVPGAEAVGSVREGFLNLTYQTAQGNSSETFQCVWGYNDENGERFEATPYNITLNEATLYNMTRNTESFFSVNEKFMVYIKVTKVSLCHGLLKIEPFFVSTAIGNNSAHQTSNKKTPLWQCEKARGVCNLTGVAVSDDVTLNLTCSQDSPQSDTFNCTNLPYHEVRLDNSQDCSNSIGIILPATIICFIVGIVIGACGKNSIVNTLKNITNICYKGKTKETSIQNSDENPTENKEDVPVEIKISGDDTDESRDDPFQNSDENPTENKEDGTVETEISGDDTDESGDDPSQIAVRKREFDNKHKKYRAPLNLQHGEEPRPSGVESNDANGQKKETLV